MQNYTAMRSIQPPGIRSTQARLTSAGCFQHLPAVVSQDALAKAIPVDLPEFESPKTTRFFILDAAAAVAIPAKSASVLNTTMM